MKTSNIPGANCPICGSTNTAHLLDLPDAPVFRCANCGFRFLHPQPTDDVLRRIYSDTYFLGSTDKQMGPHVTMLKSATAGLYLDWLAARGIRFSRLLEVGCGDGDLLRAAEKYGYEVTGVEYSEHAAQRARAGLVRGRVLVGELDKLDLPAETYDVCVLADVIEHVRDPRAFLRRVWKLLRSGGQVLIATPTCDSWSARVMGSHWMEYKTEHMSYFSRRTLDLLLAQTGFKSVQFSPGFKVISLYYVRAHFTAYPVPMWTTLVKLACGCLPRRWLEAPRRLAGSGLLALAVKDATFREAGFAKTGLPPN